MSEILYIVMHSAEGWEPFLRRGHRPGEDASWTFSNCQDGDFYQHYPLSALTFTSGGYTQNRDGLACENEGVAGQPLNAAQVANARRMRADAATVCPNLRAPLLGAGFREHSELTNGATTCPSGRISPLYRSYLKAQEEDMTEEEHNTLMTLAKQVPEVLHLLKGGELGDQTGLGRADSVLGKLDTMPTLALSDDDLKKLAKYVNDDHAERMKE